MNDRSNESRERLFRLVAEVDAALVENLKHCFPSLTFDELDYVNIDRLIQLATLIELRKLNDGK